MYKRARFYRIITKTLTSVLFILLVQNVDADTKLKTCDPGYASVKNINKKEYECKACSEVQKEFLYKGQLEQEKKDNTPPYTEPVCPGVSHEYDNNNWSGKPYVLGYYGCKDTNNNNINIFLKNFDGNYKGFGFFKVAEPLLKSKTMADKINIGTYPLTGDKKYTMCTVRRLFCAKGFRVSFDGDYPKCVVCKFPGEYKCSDYKNDVYADWSKDEMKKEYDKNQKCKDGLVVKKLDGACESNANTNSSSSSSSSDWDGCKPGYYLLPKTITDKTPNKKMWCMSCKEASNWGENVYCPGISDSPGISPKGISFCSDGKIANKDRTDCVETQVCIAGQIWNPQTSKCEACTSNVEWINYANESRMYCPGVMDKKLPVLQQLKKCPKGAWPNTGLTGCDCRWGTKDGDTCKNMNISASDLQYGPKGKSAPLVEQCWTKSTPTTYKKCMGFDD